MGVLCLWCYSPKHHHFCIAVIGRAVLPASLIPLVKMLYLVIGATLQDRILIAQKLTKLLILTHLSDWPVMDIGYFSYFLSLYLLDKETQCDTYLNPCSKFTLNFLDSIYSQMTPFRKRSFLLELEPLSSDYALFSKHDRGYADLPKCLWLCMSKRAGVFSHLFLYCFLLKYYIKIHKTLEI